MPRQSLVDADKLPIADAARVVGRHPATLYSWRKNGIRGVKLPVVRVGGRTYVLRDDLERFVAALSDPRVHPALAAHHAGGAC